MKRIYVIYVMIFSLLLAVCGCSNDGSFQQGPASEYSEEPGIEQENTGKSKSDSSGKQEQNEPVFQSIDQEETDNNDPDLPEGEPPEFVDFYLYSKKEIHFNFSSAVKYVSCTFSPYQEIDCFQDGKIVKVFLKENLELQTNFLIELNVKDKWENELSIEVPLFINDWIPKMEINELRTEYESAKNRAEFIEFKVKSAGFLDELQLYILWNAKEQYIFDFPNVYVKSGEYVVFHLRTLESTCVNELGEDLAESGGTDSCPTARDLWVPGKAEWLHKTDIVYLKDANGDILDAIVMNETPSETWSRGHFAEIVENLYNKGAWKAEDGRLPGPLDAVDTSKTTVTKSISRYEGKENTHTAKDWYITDTGGASPGLPNKPNK